MSVKDLFLVGIILLIKKILEGLDKLVEIGVEKGYLGNSKGAVNYYNQVMRQGVIRDHMIETGKEPAFYDKDHSIKMGEERRFDTILADMNASRLGRESDEHKNMRTAVEELQA